MDNFIISFRGGILVNLSKGIFDSSSVENIHYLFAVSNGTTASVFPNGAHTFKIVFNCGLVLPFSILAIMGCFTPLNSSSFFDLYPFPVLL